MREIRFRAWDKDRGLFNYPKLWGNSMPSNWEKFSILEQFTGLRDKNGVEIYDGDIVKVPCNYIGRKIVKWDGRGAWNISNYDISKLSIIGNIHENPGLIGDTNA